MADSVNRIAPPSISRDRSAALGGEGEKKNRGDFRGLKHEEKSPSSRRLFTETKENGKHSNKDSENEQTKGKNLDVSV